MVGAVNHRVRNQLPALLLAWLFLAVVFLTTGVILRVRSHLAVGTGLLATLVFQSLRVRYQGQRLEAVRQHSPRVLEGDEVTVLVHLRNTSYFAIYLLQAFDRFRAGSRTVRGVVGALPPLGEATFQYRTRCDFRRGLFVNGPIETELSDELGLFRIRRSIPVFTNLIVCPRPLKTESFQLLQEGTRRNVGIAIVPRTGRSEQFAGVREYREGDALRFIHWPTTARLGKPHIKEFDRSAVSEVTIVVDMFMTGQAGVGALTSFEQRLRAATTIASTAIEKCHLVRILAAIEPAETTRLGGGPRHLQYLMEWLALRMPRGKGDLAGVLNQHLSLLRRGSTLVCILSSTNTQLATLVPVLHALRRKQVLVVAVIVEDRSYLKLREEQCALFELSAPTDALVRTLRDAGAKVYLLARGDDIVTTLETGPVQ